MTPFWICCPACNSYIQICNSPYNGCTAFPRVAVPINIKYKIPVDRLFISLFYCSNINNAAIIILARILVYLCERIHVAVNLLDLVACALKDLKTLPNVFLFPMYLSISWILSNFTIFVNLIVGN